eukprot:CAMPEP_0172777618 /NCGR_PEP_ID=MMETSP1074-20121228/201494_1 /TAXON_ID=2916 /ORGANISM="Ceratium fusus, Strain PA161109" /LENGTH=133 /DNA_ID=CAMNT_0013614543 /DNA_START=209 /DNA_END=610 /DNA_ORIENTATION=+
MVGGATSVATHPAWAYVCGGKNCKANNMVVVAPAEDGVSDKQIAVLFVIALVGFFAALDVIKKLADGVNPSNPRRKGNGVSDKQIAVLFVIALVGFFAALDVIKKLADGVNPSNPRRKGNITPLVKRIIENGY